MKQDEKPAEAIHDSDGKQDDLRAAVASLKNELNDFNEWRKLSFFQSTVRDDSIDQKIKKIQQDFDQLNSTVLGLKSEASKSKSCALESKNSVERFTAVQEQGELRAKIARSLSNFGMIGFMIDVMVGMSALYLAVH